MKKLYIYGTAVLMALCTPVFTSCGDDSKEKDEPTPDGPNKPSGQLTPEESKVYLEDAGKAFLQQFKPEEQQQLIELVSYFEDHYGYLEAPEEWEEDDSDWGYYSMNPNDAFRALKAAMHGNASAMTRAASVYEFRTYSGIYQPGSKGRWEKTGDSDKIIFRFFKNGETCELTASDLKAGEWRPSEFDTNITEMYILPYKVGVSLTEKGKELMKGTISFVPNYKNKTCTASYDVTAANLRMTANLNATDTRIVMKAQGTVNGKTLIDSDATLEGNHLCDYDVLKVTEDFSSLLDNASANMDIIGKVQLKSKGSHFDKVGKLLGNTYTSYNSNNYEDGRKKCDKDCKELNRYIQTGVYYGTNTQQASIEYQPYLYGDTNSWWQWAPESVICFSDGTTYEFNEFFGDSQFLSVKNLYEDLVESYMKLWNKNR